MRILLATEGTYPYFGGGVSTWAHDLVTGLPEHDFTIAAVIGNPHVARAFPEPANSRTLPIPLWGTERLDEYVARPRGRRAAADQTSTETFLRAYEQVVENLVGAGDPRALGAAFAAIADHCVDHDLRKALSDPRCWNILRDRLAAEPSFRDLPLSDAVDVARLVYRYLTPLAVPLPEVDVAHTSGAAVCALPALAAKLRTGVPLLLSEHGVYVRERVLQLVRDDADESKKALLTNFTRAIARCAYAYADAVLPVCEYNVGWEEYLGVDPDRIRVVYNGVDPERFPPRPVRLDRPTIAFVGRIEPLKDVLGLIRAVAEVRRSIPDVQLRLHGPEVDAAYATRCRAAAADLGDAVVFEGPAADPARAYQESDLVVLCSVSEGFPYTVVEAMCTGRPVVATAVGGVPEALGRPDLLVEPQDAQALGERIVSVLRRDPQERAALGAGLRERALRLFTRDRFLDDFRELYREVPHDRVA